MIPDTKHPLSRNSSKGPNTVKRESTLAGSAPPESGYVGNLSTRQNDVLCNFRVAIDRENLLTPCDTLGTDDPTLLRFLRARSFQLDKSLVMLREAVKWRANAFKGASIDELYEEVSLACLLAGNKLT